MCDHPLFITVLHNAKTKQPGEPGDTMRKTLLGIRQTFLDSETLVCPMKLLHDAAAILESFGGKTSSKAHAVPGSGGAADASKDDGLAAATEAELTADATPTVLPHAFPTKRRRPAKAAEKPTAEAKSQSEKPKRIRPGKAKGISATLPE